jgi:hypothetical protein
VIATLPEGSVEIAAAEVSMNRNLLVAGLILILVLPCVAGAEHNPLLPRPQKVQYGDGTLALRGVVINLPADASAEDRFTAQELSSNLARIAGTAIPISDSGASGTAITLRRTGGVDALPIPGETAGPDSREAYSINVTPAGAEVQGRSSAAVYYGVQTLQQLAEGTGAQAHLPAVEIHDWPSLPYRGVMIDTSHGPLPTESEVKRQLDFLARWKINQYYLYSEASVALEGYPILPSDAQFSQDAIRRLVVTRASGTSMWCLAWNSTATFTISSASSAMPTCRWSLTAASSIRAIRRLPRC